MVGGCWVSGCLFGEGRHLAHVLTSFIGHETVACGLVAYSAVAGKLEIKLPVPALRVHWDAYRSDFAECVPLKTAAGFLARLSVPSGFQREGAALWRAAVKGGNLQGGESGFHG